ncbi:helix-turn-helix domain-containing protein [Actinoplanes sp. NPDC026619]|uniref:helix-turn-helix domain-containing protein n=1 Tax=Actinoplanes sp. NPDC026619 TaxID=3155798 RepID=UPI0033D874E6
MPADQRRALRLFVARRYTAGACIRQIAGELGRSYGLVHQLLQEAQVVRRSRTGRYDLDRACAPPEPTL